MNEIIVHTQKELDAAIKIFNVNKNYIVIKNTTEWLSVSGNATIQSVYGNATIQSVYDNATIKSVYDNATIKIFSATVTIESCFMLAVIIMIGCACKIKKKTKTVTVIKNKIAEYNKKSFCQIYQDNFIDKDTIKLYKSVRPDSKKDFHSNTIKYEGEVSCPDYDESPSRECGGGLHLSPLPHLALSFNQGLLLECAVKIKDFVVYSKDILKVRCKKVTVIGEYKK